MSDICVHCNKPTNDLAGDPGQWKVLLHYMGEGKAQPWHQSCVSEQLRELAAANAAREKAEAERDALKVDAERYRARRYCDWSNYDEYCDAVMPRDGSATRDGFDQFIKNYDENSDGMVEDCKDIDARKEGE